MFDENRLKHSLVVATRMKQLVKDYKLDFSPEEAYTVGWLHDIGYSFTDVQLNHAVVGGHVLKGLNYKFWKEVYWHGHKNPEYDSFMLQFLDYVDITTDYDGTVVNFDERIKNVIKRYGEESEQVCIAKAIVERARDFLAVYCL